MVLCGSWERVLKFKNNGDFFILNYNGKMIVCNFRHTSIAQSETPLCKFCTLPSIQQVAQLTLQHIDVSWMHNGLLHQQLQRRCWFKISLLSCGGCTEAQTCRDRCAWVCVGSHQLLVSCVCKHWIHSLLWCQQLVFPVTGMQCLWFWALLDEVYSPSKTE